MIPGDLTSGYAALCLVFITESHLHLILNHLKTLASLILEYDPAMPVVNKIRQSMSPEGCFTVELR